MVQSGRQGAAGIAQGNRQSRNVGYEFGAGWGADLIGHHGQAVSLCGQLKDFTNKIVAASGVHPTGPKNQMFAPRREDRLVALALGLAVYTDGVGRVGFAIGKWLCSIKNVIGRIMDQ